VRPFSTIANGRFVAGIFGAWPSLLGRSATVDRRSLIRRLMSISQRSLADPFQPVANGSLGEPIFPRM